MTAETFAVTLTERQRDVARLVADGFRRDEIAQILGCNPLTVKRHVENIALRLPGPGSVRARIARYLREHG